MSAAVLVALLLVPHARADPSSCAAGSGTCESEFDGVELSLIQSHVKTDSKTKITDQEKDEITYLEEQMNLMKTKIQALKSAKQDLNGQNKAGETARIRGESQIQRQKARLSVAQQAKFDHLHSLMEAVKHGHVDAINGDALANLLHEVSPQDSNVMLSDAKEVVEILDKNKDGKLDEKEFHNIFYPKVELGKVDPPIPADDDPDPVPVPSPKNVSLAQTKTGTTGSWQYYSNDAFHGERYSEPRWFKPRINIGSSGYTTNACWLVSMVLPGSSCYVYFYSNYHYGGGMCRCYPADMDFWKPSSTPGYIVPDWQWYASGSGNHIYRPL